jgi:6,7-dimethyl-8-ribityllumazine synthase
VTQYSGSTRGAGRRIGVVVSRFNDLITDRLLTGARSCLLDHGVAAGDIHVAWAPGAWELPLAAQLLLEKKGCDAIVALGCVIRGDTPHFDYVAGAAASGLSALSMRTGRPVTFGVLTVDTTEQALSRAGGKLGNKGWEAALAALEMLDLAAALEADRGA